jgi:FdhD protein
MPQGPHTRVQRLAWPETDWDTDRVATEEPLEIRVEGRPLVVAMRTPGHDIELAAGFLYTEGLIDGADDIAAIAKIQDPLDPQDNTLNIRLASGVDLSEGRFASAQRNFYASSSCGLCGKATIASVLLGAPPLNDPRRADHRLLLGLPQAMRKAQETFERTGGLHAAALFAFDGTLEVLREDIGRHNAVDKVLGWRLRRDQVPVDDRILLVSGRAGFELVQKALVARVPVLAAVGAPSSLAVQLAVEGGMQLVGFLRDGRFNVYSPVPIGAQDP